MTCLNPLPHNPHTYLADSDAISYSSCRGKLATQHQGGGAEFHARQIRKAIRDAEADGFTVDFNWHGALARDIHLAVVHADTNWKKATRIWPIE